MSHNKLTLEAVSTDSADPMAKTILENTQKTLGFVPNMYSYFANSPALLKSYTDTYTLFRNNTDFNGVEQEVVFLTISRENACHYCMAAHSFVADNMTHVPTEVTEAIRDNTPLPDAKLNALSELTKAIVVKRGNIDKTDVENFTSAGYTETQILDVIVALSAKIISNYTNHIFHTPIDDVFAGRAWDAP
ncbi:MAG TPA: carboxymuconolactone decarboxylase family protein [Hellea balneolensis]|uniref:Carboxymuconolactone decarboxylase family protein n=1 Tax=Hellea balneolensis TaxID=287478 RepID=A0A7C3FZ24_9PROT|nr:carboxymuconolactone decarboxylase family protein [Hellea balneolensis]